MLRVWNGPPFLQLLSVFTKINEAELIGFFLPPPPPPKSAIFSPARGLLPVFLKLVNILSVVDRT